MVEIMKIIKKQMISKTGILCVLVLILLIGAVHSIRIGNGFLFIPAYTPTSTETPTATIMPSATNTASPTVSPAPTFDQTAFVDEFYTVVTQTADVVRLMQTPTVTPTVPDSELSTGLKMVNPADGKTLFFIETKDNYRQHGFWIDWNEVSNDEYRVCVRLEFCPPPQSSLCSGVNYYTEPEYHNYPVVNITEEQASAYCAWAGMELMTVADWMAAADVMKDDAGNYDQENSMPFENTSELSNITGNVWEWTSDKNRTGEYIIAGGSWKTSVHDISAGKNAEVKPDTAAEDLGFRCVKRVR